MSGRIVTRVRGAFVVAASVASSVACASADSPSELEAVGVETQALSVFDPPQPGQPVTVCFGMHCCPSGFAMRGAHVNDNRFICEQVSLPSGEDCFVDKATRRSGTHACPAGTYMRGLHAANDQVACCFDRGRGFSALSSESVDLNSQESGMHACQGKVMTGISVPQNRFLCSTVGTPAPSTPTVPINPQARRSRQSGWDQTLWKKQVRNWLARILDIPTTATLGSWPPAPSITTLGSEFVSNGFVTVERRRICYPSARDGAIIFAYLILPQNYNPTGSTRFPALLYSHGHSTEAKDGPGKMQSSAYHAQALYLAQNGFVVLSPDTRSWGEFLPNGQSEGPYLQAISEANSQDFVPTQIGALGAMPQKVVVDDLTNLSVLSATGAVDQNRIATSGLSLGGWQSMWTAAMDPRVSRATISGIFLRNNCLNNPAMHHYCQTVPSLSLLFDPNQPLLESSDLAGLLAPKPLLVQWGQADGFFASNQACWMTARDETRNIYNALGVGSSFRFEEYAVLGHEVENLQELDFLRSRSASTVTHDFGTQCNGMHCCPAGQAMIGAHGGRNEFLCTPVSSPATETCVVDSGTQRGSMHACPAGMYMRGHHEIANLLTCCRDTARPGAYFSENQDPAPGAESATVLGGMHGCPSFSTDGGLSSQPTVMTGIHVVDNRQLCAPACSHSEFSLGSALGNGCSSCAAQVCAADPFCCNNSWDGLCVNRARSTCPVPP